MSTKLASCYLKECILNKIRLQYWNWLNTTTRLTVNFFIKIDYMYMNVERIMDVVNGIG